MPATPQKPAKPGAKPATPSMAAKPASQTKPTPGSKPIHSVKK